MEPVSSMSFGAAVADEETFCSGPRPGKNQHQRDPRLRKEFRHEETGCQNRRRSGLSKNCFESRRLHMQTLQERVCKVSLSSTARHRLDRIFAALGALAVAEQLFEESAKAFFPRLVQNRAEGLSSCLGLPRDAQQTGDFSGHHDPPLASLKKVAVFPLPARATLGAESTASIAIFNWVAQGSWYRCRSLQFAG